MFVCKLLLFLCVWGGVVCLCVCVCVCVCVRVCGGRGGGGSGMVHSGSMHDSFLVYDLESVDEIRPIELTTRCHIEPAFALETGA